MPDIENVSLLRLREFLPYRLSVLSNTISTRIASLYDREFGLSIWQWRVMAVTGDRPGISATEIGQLTAMDKVAVGRDVYELIVPMALGAEQKLASSLTEEEQKQLERLMGKLADAASPDRPLW